MPVKIVTVYECSFCRKEFNEPIERFVLNRVLTEEAILLDVCSDCCDIAPMCRVIQAGYQENKPKRTYKKKPAKKDEPLGPETITPHSEDLVLSRTEKTYPCPDCDHVSRAPQGLGAHRRSNHGYASARVRANQTG